MILNILLLFVLPRTLYGSGVEAPCPPALTPSNWAIAHGSTWNSDVSGLDGPSRTAKSVQLMINEDNITDISSVFLTADSITLAHSSVDGYIWGSGVSGVYQLKVDESGLSVINTYFRDFNFEYHGAYSLLAADGTYFAAARTSIQGYHNEVPMDFSTPIVMTKEYFVPNLVDGEHIVGLTMTHDAVEKAFLVYATTMGKVGAVSLDFQTVSSNIYQIEGVNDVELPDHFVSNSIGMDGPEGGIYVCTSSSMNRLQWNPETLVVSNHWSTAYGDGHDEWFWGRLGPGCGTSPTVMGPTGSAEYVVITDGESPMNILFYNVKTGALAGKQTVTFGGATGGNSTTDQSIVVLGYKAVVVNNYVAGEVTSFCSEWFANSDASDALKHECPYLFGAFVPGIEQFELNPTTGEVTSVWSNAEVSCTSTVPIVAAASSEVLYCLGKRYLTRSEGERSTYTIEAVDWNTGRSLYYVDIGPTMLSNGLYAGTIVGTKGDIVMGTLAGVVRVSEGSTESTAAAKKAEENSPVMRAWNKMAEWSAAGHVPTEGELAELGVKVPSSPSTAGKK